MACFITIHVKRFFIDCGNLTSLPNGELMLDIANESFFNATAGVTCNAGFDSNTTSITCLATGKWEGAECTPRCKKLVLFFLDYLNIVMCCLTNEFVLQGLFFYFNNFTTVCTRIILT